MKTEFEFSLPKGFLDLEGNLHQQGKIRCATGEDELRVAKDHRFSQDPSYGIFLILSQVITCLGQLEKVTPESLESLFLVDFYYLQKLYTTINFPARGRFRLGE